MSSQFRKSKRGRARDPFPDEETTRYEMVGEVPSTDDPQIPVVEWVARGEEPTDTGAFPKVSYLPPALKLPEPMQRRVGSSVSPSPSPSPSHGRPQGPRAADVREVPSDAVPLYVLKDIIRLYSEYVGPAARPVVVEEMQAMGVTPKVMRLELLPSLAVRLAARLDTQRAKQGFLQSVRDVHPRLRS